MRVAVAAPHDAVVTEALKDVMAEGIAQPILVGRRDAIARAAEKVGLDWEALEMVEATTETEAAQKAVGLVRMGRAEMVMKGHLSTVDVLRAVLDRENGLRAGGTLSHIAVVELPGLGRLLFTTDGGINIHPDLERKVDIIRNAITAAHALDLRRPYVGLLAAVETVNKEMPATTDAARIAAMARAGAFPGAVVDGPISLDLALSAEAATMKGYTGSVAGKVDILVAPYIEVGNIMTKAMIYGSGAQSAGVVVGATAPVVLLSRADSVATKLNSIVLGALIARGATRSA